MVKILFYKLHRYGFTAVISFSCFNSKASSASILDFVVSLSQNFLVSGRKIICNRKMRYKATISDRLKIKMEYIMNDLFTSIHVIVSYGLAWP